MSMFEKFTEKAKRILFLARYEASQQGGKAIQTEHILLGLLKEGEETTRELFTRANVSIDLLQAELERHSPIREKLSTSVEIPFSDDTKKVLQYAEEEAERQDNGGGGLPSAGAEAHAGCRDDGEHAGGNQGEEQNRTRVHAVEGNEEYNMRKETDPRGKTLEEHAGELPENDRPPGERRGEE